MVFYSKLVRVVVIIVVVVIYGNSILQLLPTSQTCYMRIQFSMTEFLYSSLT